jgi:hypothetical protein
MQFTPRDVKVSSSRFVFPALGPCLHRFPRVSFRGSLARSRSQRLLLQRIAQISHTLLGAWFGDKLLSYSG